LIVLIIVLVLLFGGGRFWRATPQPGSRQCAKISHQPEEYRHGPHRRRRPPAAPDAAAADARAG
jgi:hypothetical protein